MTARIPADGRADLLDQIGITGNGGADLLAARLGGNAESWGRWLVRLRRQDAVDLAKADAVLTCLGLHLCQVDPYYREATA